MYRSKVQGVSWARIGCVALALALVGGACASDDGGAADSTAGGATSAAPAVTEPAPSESTAPGSTSEPSSSNAPTGTAPEPTNADEDAVLKIGDILDTPVTRPVLDPAASRNAGSYLFFLYDSLLRQDREGNYSPGLAESASIVDASTIAVTLRPGLSFQDGTPLDAEAVKFSILRNRDAKNAGAHRPQLQAVDSIDVSSPTDLVIHLNAPISGAWYNLLAQVETLPVSPTAVNAGKDMAVEPVGAGPFKLVSQSDQLIRFEKWADYPEADQVHLAAIEVVNVSSGEALINAYRTGAIDYNPTLSFAQLAQLEGAPIESQVGLEPSGGADWIALQCNANPQTFGDLRARQALIYATDREAINEVVYQGQGEVQTQLVSTSNPLYDAGLEGLYTHDVEKAKALLAEAGMSDLTVTMSRPNPAYPSLGQIAEMLQQQWKEAGITLEFVTSTEIVKDFYMDGNIQSLAVPATNNLQWTDKFTRLFTAESLGGTCNPTDPAFTEDLQTLMTLDADSPEAAELFQKLERFLVDDARFVPLVLPPTTIAWSDRLGELTLRPNAIGNLTVDVLGTYVAAD